ncbi:M15 family metallopeptidase [Undibacter mobilis]|uniref:D-alanyl-D-alanine dipeptidase n=1 Tax=Undibacter mobilis TaxID=2292256 RepID=A0A371B187_9BRAD|nr:M15 family metallopeptidase [Undibacter mobilis]RDV01318.1 peptidase M15 [Undibacter mobilis]
MKAAIAIVMAAFAVAAEAAAQTPLVYLRDIDASIRQDMRYAGPDNFTGRPLPGYDAAECMVRQPVALALKRVQAALAANGYSLKVYDCYRPTRAVAAMAAWARDPKATPDTSRFYPKLDKSRLFALGYISNRSAHSRGVAVDLTVVPLNAAPVAPFAPVVRYGACTTPQPERAPDDSLDMGTGFDCFDVKSHTASPAITPAQTANRRILLDAMRKHGFTNYKREWWHFSYGRADDGVAFNAAIRKR